MNRDTAIRDFFSTHYPETRFMKQPPNDAGFWFGHSSASPDLFPIIHIFTLQLRTFELDDNDFNRCLYGLSEVIRMFYQATDRRWAEWPPDLMGDIRARLMEENPDVEAVLARVLDVE